MVVRAARLFLQWTKLKPHSTNGLPGLVLFVEDEIERVDFVFKGDRGLAEVTLARCPSGEGVIEIVCAIDHGCPLHASFEEGAATELGEWIRREIGPALFDDAERFRIQGTDLCATTPWDVIQAFFGFVHIDEEEDLWDALHEVEIEALDPVRIEQDWLSRRSEELVDILEQSFEVEFAYACIPEDGLLEEEDGYRAIGIMLNAVRSISSLFVAREVVASRCYGRDEVCVIMANTLDG